MIICQIFLIFVTFNFFTMAINNGFVPTQVGRKLSNKSSEESKWLYLILNAIISLNSSLHNLNSSVFVVGTTVGAPANGASTWTVKTTLLSSNPKILLNGVIVPISVSGQIITLGSGTFATNDIVTLIN